MSNSGLNIKIHLQKQVTCPHCWETFVPENCLWIAEHSDLLGDRRLGADHKLRFLPTRFDVQGNAIDPRGFPCTRLACPNCHLEVPRALFEMPATFWSIIGAPACGKSYFLASMTWKLRRTLPQKLALTLNDVAPTSNRILNENEELAFLNPNADQVVAIRKTELQGELYDTVLFGDQTISYPRPFIFGIRPLHGHANYDNSDKVGRVLCVYDNAGEHFLPGEDKVGSPVTGHLARSRVLFFLFDPTQDPRFRSACRECSDDPQMTEASRTSRQETILHEAADRIRRHTGLRQNEKHQRPLIIILTKFDAWKSLLKGRPLRSPLTPITDKAWHGLDLRYIDEVSMRLRELLWEYSPELVAAAEGFAEEVRFFPVSATGTSPRVDKQTGIFGFRSADMNPLWAEIPTLYALCRWSSGLVPFLSAKSPDDVNGEPGAVTPSD